MTPNSPLAETEAGCRDASGRNYTYNYDIDYVTYLCYELANHETRAQQRAAGTKKLQLFDIVKRK